MFDLAIRLSLMAVPADVQTITMEPGYVSGPDRGDRLGVDAIARRPRA